VPAGTPAAIVASVNYPPELCKFQRDADPTILNAAYNDAAGVTAAFNLNLLERINRELYGAFRLEKFCHRAFYNREKQRIEMHLVSLARQKVRVMDKLIDFRRGETIHSENSWPAQ
jgi:uncharacterized SAM-dependent methyltransferase